MLFLGYHYSYKLIKENPLKYQNPEVFERWNEKWGAIWTD